MDFKIGLIRPRELRAVLLIGASLATILVVSVQYLHPAPNEAPVVSQAPAPQPTTARPIADTPADGGYVKWQVIDVPGESGGH